MSKSTIIKDILTLTNKVCYFRIFTKEFEITIIQNKHKTYMTSSKIAWVKGGKNTLVFYSYIYIMLLGSIIDIWFKANILHPL
jgi:hypothetical protein